MKFIFLPSNFFVFKFQYVVLISFMENISNIYACSKQDNNNERKSRVSNTRKKKICDKKSSYIILFRIFFFVPNNFDLSITYEYLSCIGCRNFTHFSLDCRHSRTRDFPKFAKNNSIKESCARILCNSRDFFVSYNYCKVQA